MPSIINTNINSLTAQRQLGVSQLSLASSMARLSSGLRINSAQDDAAGLAISERFTSQIMGSNQAQRNANDGISLAQTAEGTLSTAGDILQRIRELAVQSANATNSSLDRAALQGEVTQLSAELDRIASTTSFNGQKILNSSSANTYQVGANAGEVITTSNKNFRTDSYGNYRIGSKLSTATDSTGDLTSDSLAYAIASSAKASSRVAAGNVSIYGSMGTTQVSWLVGASAKSVAATINEKASLTGVTATAQTKIDTNTFSVNSYTWSITSNNTTAVSVSFDITANTATGLSGAISTINEQTSKTGVTAQLNSTSTGITLLNSDGANIKITSNHKVIFGSGNGGADYTITGGTGTSATTTATATGELVLDSDKSFSVKANVGTDFFSVSTTSAASLQKVNQVDVGSVDAANRTISLVDGAIQAINSQRAKYGALQSRLESTISDLRTTSENLSASRSRIRDTDFAAETANLTRSQILQQAGTAMLAQANALPQQVLSLLK